MGWEGEGKCARIRLRLGSVESREECRLEIRGVHEEPLRVVRIGLEWSWEGISRLGRTNLAFG